MSIEQVQRFRYEGGDLNYEPHESAPADWDGNLEQLERLGDRLENAINVRGNS